MSVRTGVEVGESSGGWIWPALFVQLETLESVLLKPLNTLVIRSPWSKVEVGSDGAWKRGSELVDVSS